MKVIQELVAGHEGHAVPSVDLGDGGGLHVFAEGAVAGVEVVDALVEWRRTSADVTCPTCVRGARCSNLGKVETLWRRLGVPPFAVVDGQIA